MKISIDWLNTYLDKPVDADEAESLLTSQGFPIEGRDDVGVIDVEVTSNRGDCLSHVGMAREVAGGLGCRLVTPDCQPPYPGDDDINELTAVDNQSLDACPTYTARIIRGVKVGPSPKWLTRRLETIGLRTINNIVDVTNYVLHELGQPLHAFDLNLLAGRRIIVRPARDGEPFTAIDGSNHKLNVNVLVIADADKPVAIAGIMGGLHSEVGNSTTDILLESARFDPLSIRRTSRRLKLSSDSSYRFERGVDPVGVDRAGDRATKLIIELAGGCLARGVITAGPGGPGGQSLRSRPQVAMRVARCIDLLGIKIAPNRMVQLLDRLGLSPKLEHDVITCTRPSHRNDLTREVDLIEEVARMHGLDQIPTVDRISIVARPQQTHVLARQKLGQVLVAHGFYESITFSFIDPSHGKPFVPDGESALVIDDERRKSEPMLRPSVLPSLLACRKSNQHAGNTQVKLFELAQIWAGSGGRIIERQQLALLIDASNADNALRDLRGSIDELTTALAGPSAIGFEPMTDQRFTVAAKVTLQGESIGVLGLLSPALVDLFDLQTPVAACELLTEKLLACYPPSRTVRALPRFPAIERDLSVIVDEQVQWQQIEQCVHNVGPQLLDAMCFITTYRGKPIERGRKSVSFRMSFRDPQGTLRHEQVDPQVAVVVNDLKKNLGAELRA